MTEKTKGKDEKESLKSQKKDLNIFLRIINYFNNNVFGISQSIIFELDLKNPDSKRVTNLEITLKIATKEDIKKMDKKLYNYNKKGKKYSIERLEKGDKCVLAIHKGQVIGYLWTMKDTMELSQFNHIPLSKNRAYTYKSFVLKDFRGKRIHGSMYNYLCDLLKKEGKEFVISVINTNNKASLKTKSSIKYYKKIGKIINLNFFGLKYDYIKKKDLSYLQNP